MPRLASSRTRTAGLVTLAATAVLTAPLSSLADDPSRPVAPERTGGPSWSTATQVVSTGRASKVAIDVPASVQVGQPIEVTGRIPVARGTRRVSLRTQEVGARSWASEDHQRTSRRGEFTLTAEALDEPGRLRVQVVAKRERRTKAVRRTILVRITETGSVPTPTPTPTSTPTPTGPKGDPNDWVYFSAGNPNRWDSCQAITWSYDPAQAPYAEHAADITAAFAEMGARTGYTFTQAPVGDADIKVNWMTPEQDPMLAGNVVGLGGVSTLRIDPARNNGYVRGIVGGRATFDASATLQSGFGRPGWGQVMLHEIGHALGLGHAAGKEQVMAPALGFYNTSWGAGDLTGLDAVGAVGKPCIDWTPTTSMRQSTRTHLVAE